MAVNGLFRFLHSELRRDGHGFSESSLLLRGRRQASQRRSDDHRQLRLHFRCLAKAGHPLWTHRQCGAGKGPSYAAAGQAMKWNPYTIVALAVLCATFLVSTVSLYFANEAQQRQIHLSTSASLWVGYQTRLAGTELQVLRSLCAAISECSNSGLTDSLDLLSSQIDLLTRGYAQACAPELSDCLVALRDYLQASRVHSPFGIGPGEATANGVRSASLGVPLPLVPDTLTAFALLVLSGAGLLLVLARELSHRTVLLREIRQLQEAERESQINTRSLLATLPVPVVVLSCDGRSLFSNRAAESLSLAAFGTADTSALARRIGEHVGPLGPGQSSTHDFPLFQRDGVIRHLSVASNGIRLLGNSVRIYAIRDDTMVRDAELRAMTAGKLSILGELSSAITHELNQPLAVIRAAAANGRVMAENLQEARKVVDKFVRIDEQVERARKIIDNVRKLARPSQSSDAPFGVSRAIGSVLGLVSQQYRLSNVSLEIDVGIDDEAEVVGNATLFEIAILNILLNAREAFVGSVTNEPPAVSIKVREQDGKVTIVIADNAGGIPEQILPRIFESFVSSKAADTGTGLGLSIARRAIEGMRGRIQAENGPSGAIFTISLPAIVQED